MNEQNWAKCTNPQTMLSFLQGRASDRKLRLFGCACCRRIWDLLSDETCRRAVGVAELFADGTATDRERGRAYRQVPWKRIVATEGDAVSYAAVAAAGAVNTFHPPRRLTFPAAVYVGEVAENARFARNAHAVEMAGGGIAVHSDEWGKQGALADEAARQADLIRDIFGNVVRPIAADPAWQSPGVVGLARTIYDGRSFDRMPALADALEEAGCSITDILDHLRGPGPHVRGCWVVDLLTGRQ